MPRISAIMPTADRRRFVPAAIAQFLAQGRDDAELVILDDGADPVADLIPGDPRIRYFREEERRVLGDKRNRLCELARGEIIAHWDDDDWYAPDRLARQLAAIEATGADIVGIDRVPFLADDGSEAWDYRWAGRQLWVCGASMAYRRAYWERHRFSRLRTGEDTRFVFDARGARIHAMAEHDWLIARVHGGNSSPKRTRGCYWTPRPAGPLLDRIAAWSGGGSPRAAVRPLANSCADGNTSPKYTQGDPHSRRDDAIAGFAGPAGEDAPAAALRDLTIVIPHGGGERLPLLAHTLERLRQALPQSPLIVAELGEAPLAAEAAARVGARHLFTAHAGPFERARALNLGSAEARTDYILWHDNDLIAAPGFHGRAIAELEAAQLDFLIPFDAIHYLSEPDTEARIAGGADPGAARPLRTLRSGSQVSGGMGLVRRAFVELHGGLDERFRGWGGEDNGWWHKASLLGRPGISRAPGQILFHLYHRDSGGLEGAAPHRANPHYQRNLALLAELKRIKTRQAWLASFPGPATPPAPAPDTPPAPAPAPAPPLHVPLFLYWEGPCPEWILRCRDTIVRHGGDVRLLDRAAFEELRTDDRDIDLDPLEPAHRADYARAWLLARHGGIWLDSDCILMGPLDTVRAALATHGFVAHRDRQSYYPNGFIAAAPGNPTAELFYRAVAERLRDGKPLSWISLGGEPLTRLLRNRRAAFHELPCAAIQPICWSRPELFFRTGSDAEHARSFAPDALTYMLSNTQVAAFVKKHPGADLLAPGSFFNFVVARSLARPVEADAALAEAGHGLTPAQVFAGYHEAALRRHDDSLSGPGSSLGQTETLRRELPGLLQELGVRILLDAGCGDHRWLGRTELPIDRYIGVDVVPDLIARNEALALTGRSFLLADFTRDDLPPAELVLTRDTLVHYDLATALCALANLRRTGARWLLATTFPDRRANPDSDLGGWRPLNLTLQPFGFPPPLRLIREGCTEQGGAYRDKSLGLWRMADLRGLSSSRSPVARPSRRKAPHGSAHIPT